jgi:hypothetical protein
MRGKTRRRRLRQQRVGACDAVAAPLRLSKLWGHLSCQQHSPLTQACFGGGHIAATAGSYVEAKSASSTIHEPEILSCSFRCQSCDGQASTRQPPAAAATMSAPLLPRLRVEVSPDLVAEKLPGLQRCWWVYACGCSADMHALRVLLLQSCPRQHACVGASCRPAVPLSEK